MSRYKITGGVSPAAPNWLGQLRAAIRQSFIGSLLAGKPRLASRFTFAPMKMLVPEKFASRLSLFSSGTLALPPVKPASRLTVPASGTAKLNEKPASKLLFSPMKMLSAEKPASEMVQVRFDLEHKSFVQVMTNRTGNTRDWTNLANAQGANNGTKANWDGSLALLQTGTMLGTTVAQSNRPASLIIDAVYVAVWGDWAGLPIVADITSSLSWYYRLGTVIGTEVLMAQRRTGSGSDSGTEFRIDNGAGAFTDTLATAVTWANIATIQLGAQGATLVGVAAQFNVDAMRLRVVAHETMAL